MPEWIANVMDSDGNEITDADVSLARESEIMSDVVDAELVPRRGRSQSLPLMAHQGAGVYRPSSPLTNPVGNWRLVVRRASRSTVVQPVVIATSSNGGFETKPRNLDPKGPASEVATVEIKTVHTGLDSQTTFLVRMWATREVVLMSGTNYKHDGAPLRKFAQGRRDLLAASNAPMRRRIDEGTIVSLWSLDDRTVYFFVKARGPQLAWVLVHEVKKPDPPPKPITPGSVWPEKPDATYRRIAIHPSDLYGYLHAIGSSSTQRGRVREVSILSHAFYQGPILYNTYDGNVGRARDPKDFDCRIKDWERPELSAYPAASKAMHQNGRWHIWGCNEIASAVAMSARANASRQRQEADDEFFMVDYTEGSARYEARIDRRMVLRYHLAFLTGRDPKSYRSYAGTLLHVMACDVFSALPGTWSSFDPANNTMRVDDDEHSWSVIERYYKEEPALKSAFAPGTGIDGLRYVNYRRFASITPPTVAARSAQYEFRQFATEYLIEFHGARIFKGKGVVKVASRPIHDVGPFDIRFTGEAGHRYAFLDSSDTETAVVIAVETDGVVRVFELENLTTGAFDTVKREITP